MKCFNHPDVARHSTRKRDLLFDPNAPEQSDRARGDRLVNSLKNVFNLFPLPNQESTSDSAKTVQVVLMRTGRSERNAVGPN